MGKPKDFDIKKLKISENIIEEEFDSEISDELLSYSEIEKNIKNKRQKKHKNANKTETIIPPVSEDLKNVDWSKIALDLDKMKSKATWKKDKKELKFIPINLENDKIEKMKIELIRNPDNNFLRIQLSKLLDSYNSEKILLDGIANSKTKCDKLWIELLNSFYTKERALEALKNIDTNKEEIYIKLYENENDISYIKEGLKYNQKSVILWNLLIEYQESITSKFGLLSYAIEMTRNDFFIDKLVILYEKYLKNEEFNESKNFHESKNFDQIENVLEKNDQLFNFSKIYNFLKENKHFNENFSIFTLNNAKDKEMFRNVRKELLERNLDTIFKVLKKVKYRIYIPPSILNKEWVNNFIKNIEIIYFTDLPFYLQSFFISFANSQFLDENLFFECYNIFSKFNCDTNFITTFFNKITHRYDQLKTYSDCNYIYDLLYCKEIWKILQIQVLYEKDLKLLKNLIDLFSENISFYRKQREKFTVALSIIYFKLGDYYKAFNTLKKIKNTIFKFVILSFIDFNKTIKDLKNNLTGYKCYLLYVDLLKIQNIDIQFEYEEGIKLFPTNINIKLEYLRYLRKYKFDFNQIQLKIENFLIEDRNNEFLLFEKYLLYKKNFVLNFCIQNIEVESENANFVGNIKKYKINDEFKHKNNCVLPISILYSAKSILKKSEIINSEIIFLERKQIEDKNSMFYGLNVFRNTIYLKCNYESFCEKCKQQLYNILIAEVFKNSDNLILLWFLFKETFFEKDIEKYSYFIDEDKGFYYKKAIRSLKYKTFSEKMNYGFNLIEEDFLFTLC
ncbi:hypothetical protein CWI38_1223p0020 [Hamiltosporidium tvaerminnensis]|uniref:Uncharacterized protein n=1 Tax=Hamiltosporidium tvaerminnensis TaxID=1176355 RepID=A0A4Q9LTC9_9MICR|nr:hypothetical protein CWI38_1223p0020 [Hamiltosporidium tvaerminnensis]